MNIKRLVTLLIVTSFLMAPLFLMSCAEMGGPGLTPPFKWDETPSFPGTSLKIKEIQRLSRGKMTVIVFKFMAEGFLEEKELYLWRKTGMRYSKWKVTLSSDGVVQIHPGLDTMAVSNLMKGEAVDIALVGTSKRAHAKLIPFPIAAMGRGGCSASAEILTPSGHVFLIIFKGFHPNEQIEITSRYKTEAMSRNFNTTDKGELAIPVLFGGNDRGKATAVAKGRKCDVSLEYNIGIDALDFQ